MPSSHESFSLSDKLNESLSLIDDGWQQLSQRHPEIYEDPYWAIVQSELAYLKTVLNRLK